MFRILKKSKKSRARTGKIITTHGAIYSPFFMPIATRGAVKCLSPEELNNLKSQIILSNTYHLFLRPGLEVIKKAGGLHKFMNWSKPILTDSGGYQVFSLAKTRKVKDQGVEFRSEIDGRKILLTPELAVKIQKDLRSDIIMVLDECVGYPVDRQKAALAVERTSRWAEKSKKYFGKNERQLIFGIVQGSIYQDLRLKSLNDLVNIGFDGYALGGLMVGEPIKNTYQIIEETTKRLPENKAHYLMGVGKPDQIIRAVKLGIDMFDCVIPTRNARHGLIYVKNKAKLYKELRITNAKYKKDLRPLDKNCLCFACQNFSRAYLRHLFINEEPLGPRLASIHNLAFYLGFMEEIRERIKKGRL